MKEQSNLRWTATLPTEGGYYWCRQGKTKPFLIELYFTVGYPIVWDIEKEQQISEVYYSEHEWWPIPITPPED